MHWLWNHLCMFNKVMPWPRDDFRGAYHFESLFLELYPQILVFETVTLMLTPQIL